MMLEPFDISDTPEAPEPDKSAPLTSEPTEELSKDQAAEELDKVSDQLEKVEKFKSELKKASALIELEQVAQINKVDTHPEALNIPKYNNQCTICKWSKGLPELYNWLTSLVLKGVSYSQSYNELVKYINTNNIQVKPPNKKCVWKHYARHVYPKDTVKILNAKKNKGAEEEHLVSSLALQEILAGNFDEYKELCTLYTKFREVHDKIYEVTGSLMTGDEWSQNKIQTYVSMVNTQKSILSEIGKMRQGDKLVSVVAKFIIEMFTKSIVTKLSEEFDTLAGVMRRQGVPNDVLDAFQSVTHERLGHLIIEEARSAMDQTKKEFKLPN